MKAKIKSIFVVTLLIASALFNLSFAQQIPQPAERQVVQRINPALTGIEEAYVAVMPSYVLTTEDEPMWDAIEAVLEDRLVEEGIVLVPDYTELVDVRGFRAAGITVLVDEFRFEGTDLPIWRVKTQVKVGLSYSPTRMRTQIIEVEVWSRASTMIPTSLEDTPDAISRLALKQLEEFLVDFKKANPVAEPEEYSEVQRPEARAPRRTERAVKKTAEETREVEFRYVASKNSKVFHHPDCSIVKRIKPENLIKYETRIEAMKDDKRPCRRCKP